MMKRFVILLLICLLLTGCGASEPEVTSTPPTEVQVTTEPPAPWIETLGIPWNEDGSLVELRLTIPDALHYNAACVLDGDLLLWSIDTHLADVNTLEMCLIELDDGTVAAEREIEFGEMVMPQIMNNQIFLCDRGSGTILELNKQLETVNSWTTEPRDASFTMGNGGMLYIYDWDGSVVRLDLNNGDEIPLFDEEVYIDYFSVRDDYVSVEYYLEDTGMKTTSILDLKTGDLLDAPLEGQFVSVFYKNGTWLSDTFRNGYMVYVCSGSGPVLQAEMGYDSVDLLSDGRILRSWEDGCTISIHDASGASLAQTSITSKPYTYTVTALIPSPRFGGYFVLISDDSVSMRLLYWDSTNCAGGEDIPFAPIPEPGEREAAVRQRLTELQEEYGLTVLAGEDAKNQFYDFSADHVTDWELVEDALDTLEDALQDYPKGFFHQLRYDTIRSIEIHLVGNIDATTAEYVDTYEAFVQYEYDRFVMGVDVYIAREQTYYHEFSHMIDEFLEWDASVREDALFSEDGWNALNPDWFPGYTYDYSWERYLEDDASFVDTYSTIDPTEDRARVMEYAMVDYGYWTFEDREILLEKLDYYCRCIRDAFDTTGWSETVLWEQYLQ